jgi:hypothetical protein
MATQERSSLSQGAVIAALAALVCALVAWLVRPDNRLGDVTRPTTIWATVACGLALVAITAAAISSRKRAGAALVAILIGGSAAVTAIGALLLLTTLPYGN